jgi:ADP-heptose:LPS heptosyltransferase
MNIPKLRLRRFARRIADGLAFLSPTVTDSKRPGTPRHIGVLAQWGIGDAILILPLIQGLKEAYPEASIDLIGKSWLADLFSGEPSIDGFQTAVPPWTKYFGKYRIWEPDWRRYISQLRTIRAQRYDLLIAPRFDVRDNLQLRLMNANVTAGFAAAGGRGWITHDLGLDLEKHNALHRAEVAAAVLQKLTSLVRSSIPRLTVSGDTQQTAMTRLRNAGYTTGPIVAVHGGAGHPVRRRDGARFSNTIAQSLPHDAFLVIVADETAPDGYGIQAPAGIKSTLWRGSLTDLKGLLSVCDILLCTDSGAMHMAAACGCRVVALFGPQKTEWFGPVGEGHRVVMVEPMPCRPCFDACIYAQPLCMDSIRERDVSSALQAALSETTRPRLEAEGHSA